MRDPQVSPTSGMVLGLSGARRALNWLQRLPAGSFPESSSKKKEPSRASLLHAIGSPPDTPGVLPWPLGRSESAVLNQVGLRMF